VAIINRDGQPFARIEFRRSALGAVTELTLIAVGQGLRIVAGREAIGREPVLAAWADRIESELRAARVR
jgi:hypothetical protein